MTFRPRVHRVLTAAAICLMLAGGAALSAKLQAAERSIRPRPDATPAAPATAGRVRPAAGGRVYWGTFRQDAPYVRDEVRAVRDEAGAWPAIQMWYQEWDGAPGFDVVSARWLRARGIVPMVTWEPWRPPAVFGSPSADQPRYRLARITAGDFDVAIARYARAIAHYGGPVMLRPFHEMDGYWYPWGGTANGNRPEDFVPAWRHVHDLFERMGATNVTWVWSVNLESVPDEPSNRPEAYWPGARYVDWIGLSGFNWSSLGTGSTWKTFDESHAARYAEIERFHKPIALTEIGAPELGGDKAAWIADTFAALMRYPRIRAVVWYDKRDSERRDWRIASSPAAEAAFRAAVSGPRFVAAPGALASAKG